MNANCPRQATLEKQVKELNLRIVDLETKSYSRIQPSTSSSAATVRRLESRVEELTSQLSQATRERHTASVSQNRDATFKLAETERQKVRLEEEVRSYEEKITNMRKLVNDMVSRSSVLEGPSLIFVFVANDRRGASAGEEEGRTRSG